MKVFVFLLALLPLGNRRHRKHRRVYPAYPVEEQEAISPEMIIDRAEVWIQPETFEQFRDKNGADYIRVKHQTSLVIIDPVCKSAFVSNDARSIGFGQHLTYLRKINQRLYWCTRLGTWLLCGSLRWKQ